MRKRVLAAADRERPTPWALFYAAHLAARLNLPLAVLDVSPLAGPGKPGSAAANHDPLTEEHHHRFKDLREQCRREGVTLEHFMSAGPFIQEVKRFALTQPGIHFLVVGVPRGLDTEGRARLASDLRRLRQIFPGEILLVQEQGKVTDLAGIPEVQVTTGRDA